MGPIVGGGTQPGLVQYDLGQAAMSIMVAAADLGTPADRPLTPIQRPNRRPFDDVAHRGHW